MWGARKGRLAVLHTWAWRDASLSSALSGLVRRPPCARVAHCPPPSLSLSPSCREPVVIIPDSEDEEEQARLCCISASQAVVADVLCDAAGTDRPSSSGAADPAAAAPAWQQDVVLQGAASVTLLLARDARGELGSDTRCFAVPAGGQAGRELTAAQLLAFVHGYYAEEVRRVLWSFISEWGWFSRQWLAGMECKMQSNLWMAHSSSNGTCCLSRGCNVPTLLAAGASGAAQPAAGLPGGGGRGSSVAAGISGACGAEPWRPVGPALRLRGAAQGNKGPCRCCVRSAAWQLELVLCAQA